MAILKATAAIPDANFAAPTNADVTDCTGSETAIPASQLVTSETNFLDNDTIYGGSESSSMPFTLPGASGLKKSDSTASAGRFSLTSHKSIPVTGTFPLGSLQVHEAMASPNPTHSIEEEEMPPLDPEENEPANALVVAPPLSSSSAAAADAYLQNGDVFLLLDLPDNSTVGCDALAMSTGTSRRFLGIRDLPPGPHFVWVSPPGAISRSGYWFVTAAARSPGRVRVKQWDRYNEVLGDPASRFEARAQRDGVAAAYQGLVPYGFRGVDGGSSSPPPLPKKDPPRGAPRAEPDFETSADDGVVWRAVTSAISEALLERVTGRRGVAEWMVDTADGAKGEAGASFAQAAGAGRLLRAAGGGELTFLFAPDDVDVLLRRPHPPSGASPADGGDAHARRLDPTTAQVLTVLDNPASGVAEADLVGELQLAFLTGMHLSNLACLEQWWHLVLRLILRAHGLALVRPRLARDLLRTMHAQLVYSERYIVGSPPAPPSDSGSTGAVAKRGGGARGDSARNGGEDDDSAGMGILDVMPRNKARLRGALTTYKRRLDEALLGLGDGITAEQAEVGEAFLDLETYLWRYGWDLRGGEDEGVGGRAGDGGGMGPRDEDEDDDEYQPVVVDLDESGREVGLLSWNH